MQEVTPMAQEVKEEAGAGKRVWWQDRSVWRAKGRASLLHVCVSAVLFAVAAWLILTQWYPGVLFEADGGMKGIALMFFVDLVLGPTLTFVIISPGKARHLLLMDLAIIATMQLSAMGWGLYTVHGQRPVVLAYNEQAFHPVVEDEFTMQKVTLMEALKNVVPAASGPTLVVKRTSANREEILAEMNLLWIKEIPPEANYRMYASLARHREQVFADQSLLQALLSDIPAAVQILGEYRSKDRSHGESGAAEPLWAMFEGRYQDVMLAFAPDDLHLLGGVLLPDDARARLKALRQQEQQKAAQEKTAPASAQAH